MFIDQHTQDELALITGEPSLFTFLDRTAMPQSRAWLKQFFQKPFQDLESIQEMQTVFRHLGRLRELRKLYLKAQQIGQLRHYLESSILPSPHPKGPGQWGDGLLKIFIYRHYDELEALFKDSLAYLHTVKELYNELQDSQPPKALQTILQPAWSFFQIPEVQQLLRHKRLGVHRVLYYDALLRGKFFPALKALLAHLYKLDALFALAARVTELKWIYPQWVDTPSPQVEIQGLYHPFLTHPVYNPLQFETNKQLLFLTGPNMAGKTTYLKACALAVYLAHLGLPVPAQAMKLSLIDCLFSSIEVKDDIQAGYSYFFNEVRRVKEAAQKLHTYRSIFFIFDELFRGTNVKDAYDCSLAVLERMVNWENALFLVSSHLTEVGENLAQHAKIQLACFEGELQGEVFYFPYRLATGLSRQRLGYQILLKEGLPELFEAQNPT